MSTTPMPLATAFGLVGTLINALGEATDREALAAVDAELHRLLAIEQRARETLGEPLTHPASLATFKENAMDADVDECVAELRRMADAVGPQDGVEDGSDKMTRRACAAALRARADQLDSGGALT